MSEIQTAEPYARLARAYGLKDSRGYPMVEAVQPVVIVGEVTNPGQRVLADVFWASSQRVVIPAATRFDWLVQNNSDDWARVDQIEVIFIGTARDVIVGVQYAPPAVAWFPTSCPELGRALPGALTFSTIRQTAGAGPLANPDEQYAHVPLASTERWYSRLPLPLPPRSTLIVTTPSAPAGGEASCVVMGSIPLQAG